MKKVGIEIARCGSTSSYLPTQSSKQPFISLKVRHRYTTSSLKTNTLYFEIHKMDSAGARSKMSQDMQEITQGREDISKTVQGHKANLSNPSEYLIISCVLR